MREHAMWKYLGDGMYESPQGREHQALRRHVTEVVIQVDELRRLRRDAKSFEASDAMNDRLEDQLDAADERINELEIALEARTRPAVIPHVFSDGDDARADGRLCICGDVEGSPWHWVDGPNGLEPPDG